MRYQRLTLPLAFALLGAWVALEAAAQSVVPAGEVISAKIWPGRYAEIESYLKKAGIVKTEDVGIGVTKPLRCDLEPGGPVRSIAFKDIPPGRHRGFWDSYRAEIAAYELDKLLGLDMVPVAVEKVLGGRTGVAVMWLEPVEPWEGLVARKAQSPDPRAWAVQITRMKMFDNLIGNPDRNAGNLLVDPAWNLLLIDHSRALTGDADLPVEMDQIDRDLWTRMTDLTEASLSEKLEPWIGGRNVRSLLERRARMQKAIDALVAAKGEARVFLR